jgi:hypothetical protein
MDQIGDSLAAARGSYVQDRTSVDTLVGEDE